MATPIGNAGDITLRALDVLARADLIACEDTRHSRKLLAMHGIDNKLVSYHDHNAARVRPKLMAALAGGAAVALISDAGTPLIADPGYRLVGAAVAQSVPVVPVPGVSAVTAALSVAGLPTDRFMFVGFLPAKTAARRAALAEFADIPATLVVLESPKRLTAALADMATVLGARPAAIARELTKRFETVCRGTLAELAADFGDPSDTDGAVARGEIVIVVGPPVTAATALSDDDIDALLRAALETQRPSDAAAAVARETGRPRRQLYARAVALKQAP